MVPRRPLREQRGEERKPRRLLSILSCSKDRSEPFLLDLKENKILNQRHWKAPWVDTQQRGEQFPCRESMCERAYVDVPGHGKEGSKQNVFAAVHLLKQNLPMLRAFSSPPGAHTHSTCAQHAHLNEFSCPGLLATGPLFPMMQNRLEKRMTRQNPGPLLS